MDSANMSCSCAASHDTAIIYGLLDFLTPQGQAFGTAQRQHSQTKVAFVGWPDTILQHKALLLSIKRGDANQDRNAAVIDHQEQSFRERFPAELRTTDGHMVLRE